MLVYLHGGIQMIFWGIVAWKDFKTKEVPILPCVGAGIAGGIFSLANALPLYEIAGGIAIGIFFCGVAFLSRGSIGYGDGVCIASIGAWIGGEMTVWLLLIAMVLLTLFGGALLAVGKATRKSRLPMLPFMYIALCVIAAGNIISAG